MGIPGQNATRLWLGPLLWKWNKWRMPSWWCHRVRHIYPDVYPALVSVRKRWLMSPHVVSQFLLALCTLRISSRWVGSSHMAAEVQTEVQRYGMVSVLSVWMWVLFMAGTASYHHCIVVMPLSPIHQCPTLPLTLTKRHVVCVVVSFSLTVGSQWPVDWPTAPPSVTLLFSYTRGLLMDAWT